MPLLNATLLASPLDATRKMMSALFSFRQISQEDKNWETNIQELQRKVLWFLRDSLKNRVDSFSLLHVKLQLKVIFLLFL